MVSDPYLPDKEPFWTDGEFRVYEMREADPSSGVRASYMACRINGSVHFRGNLRACAEWIERNRKNGN